MTIKWPWNNHKNGRESSAFLLEAMECSALRVTECLILCNDPCESNLNCIHWDKLLHHRIVHMQKLSPARSEYINNFNVKGICTTKKPHTYVLQQIWQLCILVHNQARMRGGGGGGVRGSNNLVWLHFVFVMFCFCFFARLLVREVGHTLIRSLLSVWYINPTIFFPRKKKKSFSK